MNFLSPILEKLQIDQSRKKLLPDLPNTIDDNLDSDIDESSDDSDFEEHFDSDKGAVSPIKDDIDTNISFNFPTEKKETVTFNEISPEESEQINEKMNPTMPAFFFAGPPVDMDSAIIVYLIILIWCVIWYFSGLYKTIKEGDILFGFIFFLFIGYMLANIPISGTTSGGIVYELNILLTVEQMISILFGTIILFTLFQDRLNIHPNCKKVILNLLISIVILLSLSSLWINVWNSGRSFRFIRKFKQGIYNVALLLFIIVCLFYVRGQKTTTDDLKKCILAQKTN